MQNNSDLQTTIPLTACPFHKGDAVYLAKGSYQGTIGTFVAVRDDPKWADIMEPNMTIRQHPLEWIAARPAKG